MFATLLEPQQTLPLQTSSSSSYSFHYAHAPAHSSPLAPRNVNVPSSSHCSMSQPSSKIGSHPSQQFSEDQGRRNGGNDHRQLSSPSQPRANATTTPYAQRYAAKISSPLRNISSISPAAREKRRDIFLSRVKRDREAGRFDARGEQLMMMEYVAEQKQWGEAMRRDAEGIHRAYNLEEAAEEEQDLVQDEAEIRALDEYLSQEQEMEQALVENIIELEQSGRNGHAGAAAGSPRSDRSSFYGDDDYEDIFMELVDQMDGTEQFQHSQGMDTSSG